MPTIQQPSTASSTLGTCWSNRSTVPSGTASSSQRRVTPSTKWVCSNSTGGSTRRTVQVIGGGSPEVAVKTISPPSRRSMVMSASKGSHQSARRAGFVMASHTASTG